MVPVTAFDRALDIVLRHEGGYVNDPRDPGGETNWGISKRAYPDLDIRNLTREQASDIYWRDYWNKLRPNDLPEELAIALFDAAVNQGVSKAIRLLQRALGVAQDGVVGGNTLAAVNRTRDVLARFTAERAIAYANTANFDVYARGWLRRAISTALEASK